MYEPSHIGGLLVKSALKDEFLELLRKEVLGARRYLLKGPEVYINAAQNIYVRDVPIINRYGYPTPFCSELERAYLESIYNPIAEMIGFSGKNFLSPITINMYPKGGGISYHRDESRYTNLIGAIAVHGAAEFSFARNKDGDGELAFGINPGDLVLMRSRIEQYITKEDLRPCHKIIALSERYSILIRNRG